MSTNPQRQPSRASPHGPFFIPYSVANPNLLAVVAGFLGSVLAVFARNLIMVRGAGIGPDDSRTPAMVIIYGAIASLAASVGAKEVTDLRQISSGVWIGTLAGLFSATLLGMMMIVYHTNPGEQPKLRTRR